MGVKAAKDVGVGSGYDTPLAPMQCNYCGCIWDRVNPPNHVGPPQGTTHTDAEWESWRVAQGIPDGEIYARWSPAP
jgi:hypothetical protein